MVASVQAYVNAVEGAPMSLLGRYILWRTLSSILVVMILFTSLLGLLGFADELSRRGSEAFSAGPVLWFTLLELPSELYRYFFPFIVMVGTLVSLGGLAAQGELTAIRASGMSAQRLLLIILTPAVLAMGALFWLGEGLAPQWRLEASVYRADLIGRDAAPRFGHWYHSGPQKVNVGAFISAEQARSVLIVTLNDAGQIRQSLKAESAQFDAHQWHLSGVKRVHWVGTEMRHEELAQLSMPAPLSPELIYNLATQERVLTLWQLYQRVQFLQQRAVANPVLQLAFWNRLTAPLLTFSITLIGIAFVFGSTRTFSVGARVAMGVALALALQIVQQFFGPVGLFMGLPPAVATLLPVALTLVLGGGLLYRRL